MTLPCPTGWLPDPPQEGPVLGGDLLRELLQDPETADGGVDVGPWSLNQRGESCTGHFGAQSIYALTGRKCSPYLPWYFARVRDHGATSVPDTGCSVAAFTRALRMHGACSWDLWNPGTPGFSTTGEAARPPAAARVDAQRANLDIVPLYGSGSEVVQAVAAALDRGWPVGVVVHVDEAFSKAGGRLDALQRDAPANHIVTAFRHRLREDGAREFLLVNSWSASWGENGCTWAHESWIAASSYLPVARGVS